MCTIGYIEENQLIFKNRDKTSPVEEEIVNDGNIIACRTTGERHFSCGLNQFGCGFVTASVDQYFWPYSGDLYSPKQQFPASLYLSETLPRVKDISEWERFFTEDDRIFQGANLIIFDQKQVKFVEIFANHVNFNSKPGTTIRANHFADVPCDDPNGRRTGELNTFERERRAQSYLAKISGSIDDLQAYLSRPVVKGGQGAGDDSGIWMSDKSGGLITVSVNIIDRAGLAFYHCAEANGSFTCHRFE